MSTILDALRKVEREREPSGDLPLDGPTVSPEVRRRRPFPVVAVAMCAIVGFAAGALLSWWTPGETPVEVASLPAPPPPPNIDVPRAPVRAQPKPAAAPPAPNVAADAGGTTKHDLAIAPPAVAASPVAPAAVAMAPSPAAVVPPAPAAVSVPPAADHEENAAVAALEKDSVLEPSPFGPTRGAAREATVPNVAGKKGPEEKPAVKAAPKEREPQDLAALVPPAAQEPPAAELEAPIEPEPEASPEPIFDTGRSPPGAPKVALSFLQWSSDPARRFAFISIDGAPSQRVHEGEVAGGLTVAAITPTGVQFKRENSTFVIRPRH